MAGNTAYKLGIVISADASSVKPAAAATKTEIASIGEAATVTETKMQRLIATATGLHAGPANGNQRAWTGALAAEGLALDQLRAKYNPLFSVIQNYRTAQTEIRTAHAMGALSADEMTSALQRQRQSALAIIDAIKGNSAAIAMHAAEVERLKSAYDPLYAAQQKYAAGLDQINRAQEIGAVSASEAIALRLREKASYDAVTSSINNVASARKASSQSAVDRRTITPDRGLDIATYGKELDTLRAKYNPLFQTITQYRAAQADIRQAHAVGAISADEMTSALQRQRQATLSSIDAIKGRASAQKSANGQNFSATNVMFQMQDIGVTAGMGMDPKMIALQQGPQIAGAMAGMNMKQAGATLASAFTQLLSPVAIASVAITGLTAVAIQYAMTWTGNAKSLSQRIEEHEEQIKRLNEAYQYAGSGAEGYFQRINSGTRFQMAGSRKELEKALSTGAGSALAGLGGLSSGSFWKDAISPAGENDQWAVFAKFSEFETAILHLQKTAKDGKPDILGFRQLVEERWRLDPNNDSIRKLAKELLDLSPNAVAAAIALERLEKVRADNARNALIRRAAAYDDGISGMRGVAALELSDRRKVENDYATARSNAGDRDERADALRQRDDALARINAQEQRQIQLAQIDIQLQTARDPLTRAELAAARERIQLQGMDISATEAQNRVRQARNQVMAESLAQSSVEIIDMRAEIDARKSVTDAIIAGTISSADAQTYLQAEAALRPLIIAASRAEGEEKQKLLVIINQMKAAYQGLAEEQKRANAVEMLRNQKDTATQLQLELSLISSGELVRRRALSALQAEQDLKRAGIAIESEFGKQYRQNAQALTEARITLERQTDAWSRYQSAGENAIDGIFDALGSGDYKDALKSIGLEITRTFTDLAVKNPLKNALFGTNLGTLDDLLSPKSGSGLLSGILGGQSVGAMNVQAAVVNVGGVGLGGADGFMSNVSRVFGAANSNVPGAGLGMAQYASAIKLIESAGSGGYSALGPITPNGDRAYGAYQVMGANIPSWTKSALGFSMSPQDYLKSSSAQDAVFSKIFGGYVDKFGASGAAQAWFGGPGSVGRGGGVADMLGTTGTDYVNKFNSALGQVTATAGGTSSTLTGFASNVGTAGNGLNQLGSGFNNFGQQLSSMTLGGGGGFGFNIGSLFPGAGGFQSQQLANAIASGIPGLWSSGGYTGPGGVDEPRGIVHAGEVVWSQRDVARAGGVHVVEGMRLGRRGYSNGGAVVDVAPSPIAQFNQTANSGALRNGASARPSSANFTIKLEGARGDREIEDAAYRGMQAALREFNDGLPDRVAEINQNPEWR